MIIPLYIFDIDGTIADIQPRVHLLADKANSHRWEEFYSLCDQDTPKYLVINTLRDLLNGGAEIWFFTGRTEAVREKTTLWIRQHVGIQEPNITMRENGDYTQDFKLKQSWYDSMLLEDANRLIAVFDDRQQVVDMWRRNGVTCYQVAPGDF